MTQSIKDIELPHDEHASSFEGKLARFLVVKRHILCVFSLIFLSIGLYGISILNFETDYKTYFNEDYPPLLAHLELESNYSKADNVLFVISPENKNIFTQANLEILDDLTEKAWFLPYSTRVDSLTNFQYSFSVDDDIAIERLVDTSTEISSGELKKLKSIALNEKVLHKRLISPTAEVAAMNVSFAMPTPLNDAGYEVVEAARFLAKEIMAENPGLSVYVSGVIPYNHGFEEIVNNDLALLLPILFILIVVSSSVFLRSFSASISVVILILSGTIIGVGSIGLIGWPVNNVNSIAPIIILTLAVADCVHLFTIYQSELLLGRPKQDAMFQSIRLNLQPMFLTSLTTAIGFIGLNFSESPPFRELGNIAAIGAIFTFILSLTLIPSIALGFTKTSTMFINDIKSKTYLNHLCSWVINNHNAIFWLSLTACILIITQITQIRLNDDNIGYFHKDTEIRKATDFTQENLTGLNTIHYSFNSGLVGGINDPGFLENVDYFTEWVRNLPEVDSVYSYTDTIKRLNKNLNGDDEAYYSVPDSKELAAHLLFIYEMSLPFGLSLTDQLTFDRSSMRVSVTVKNLKAGDLLKLEEKIQDWMKYNVPEIKTPGSSIGIMFAHIGQNNIKSMLTGTVVAVLLISLTFFIATGSLKFSLVSIIPNVFPAGVMFGIWGFFIKEVNLGAAVVASITLGIVVDDTVHFISKFLRARRKLKLDPEESIIYAFDHAGRAILITTIVICIGFFSLYFSNFLVNSIMGILVAGTVLIALILDFLLLPSLLLKIEGYDQKQKTIIIDD
jgi:predicted RND superfamily exporter protein